ncbi:MAG: sodium/glutamate symporter [Planctomycetaceae bacterium]
MIELGLVQTLGLGTAALFAGELMRRIIPPLGRYNLPAPVLGGLLVSVVVLIGHETGRLKEVTFDETLVVPLMIAFFTTIGFGASFSLLKKGGPQVFLFLALSTVAAVLQNVVGASVAVATGQSPLFGVLCGSVSLTGGPGTALAFAESFEKAGVEGAGVIGATCAMGGIIAGGIVGSPIGTLLIERLRRPALDGVTGPTLSVEEVVESRVPEPVEHVPPGEDVESYVLIKNVGLILIAMWAGLWVSAWLKSLGWTFPPYIGAMLIAAAMRNFDDVTGLLGLSQKTIDEVGNAALAYFLVISLMILQLWQLAAVALPLLAVLAAQIMLIAVLCWWLIFPLLGRDYDAAVMSGGFYGFMMGTTANSMAIMDALARRYGPAPRAFLVVPIVGASFIDFTNALLIQGCLSLFGKS